MNKHFISRHDYHFYLSELLIRKIDQKPEIERNAVKTAIAIVKNTSGLKFEEKGDERDAQTIRWCVSLAVYFMYECIFDLPIPLKVQKAYEETMKALETVQAVINDAQSKLETVQDENPLETKLTYTTEEIIHHYEEDKDKIAKRVKGIERIILDQEGRILYSDYIDGGYFHKRSKLMGIFDAWNMALK